MSARPDHLWQGEWIDDAELERRLADLGGRIAPELAGEPRTEPLLAAADALARELAAESPTETSRLLATTLVEAGVVRDDAEARAALREIAGVLDRKALERKLKRELGTLDPFTDSRIEYEEVLFEAWTPLGLLFHVSPQNAFSVGPMSVLEGLLAGNVNFLKTSADESLFPQRFLDALGRRDPTGWVSRRAIVARISSRRQDLLERIYRQVDGVAAWGGEESVEAIRRAVPSGVRVVEWGHKISFAYVTRDALAAEGDVLLDRIAREGCAFEQQACSSPQCVYLETSDPHDPGELRAFGEALARAFARVSPTVPRAAPSDLEAAEITMTTELHRLDAVEDDGAEAIAAPDGSWRVLVDSRPALRASPLYRTVWVKPLPRARIVDTLRPMRKYLQTAGVACGIADAYPLARALRAAGVDRIRRVGEMTGGYAGEPHDGVYALPQYARRSGVQLSEAARGIANFRELRPETARIPGPDERVTGKDAFTNEFADTARARLYFKSGGSTGEPKLSMYDYDQYREHMRLGADGLVAAGFDPVADRAMNLFFSGGLYGGFLSVFSTLEVLEAVQFPMTAHADLRMVAETIVRNGVTVLLGMPSYLVRLFEDEAEILGSYRGVKKIFYGGEHFSEAQIRFLRGKFGVASVRSLAYGSVDIGPIGYQCTDCGEGVHHLHHELHALEILNLSEDRPTAARDEIGRLVFSPRSPASNKPTRYEIGDLGHWVGEPGETCACGRAAPRFRLLGRLGDVFRIGSSFLNYRKFTKILSDAAEYAGDVQIVLGAEGLKEKITVRVLTGCVDPSAARETILRNYADLEEVVARDRVLLFDVVALPAAAFARTAGSGKLRPILDERSRA